MEDIFEAFGGTIFGDLFGGGRRRGGPQGGRDLQVKLDVTLEEIDTGVTRTIALKRKEHCETCKGSGAKAGTSRSRATPAAVAVRSTATRASSRWQRPVRAVAAPVRSSRTRARRVAAPARPTKGRDRDQHPRRHRRGVRLRVPGEGDAGDAGAPRGDLYCIVRELEHKAFQRNGSDLLCELPFSFTQLALGDRVEIPTLRGRADMSIPAGTQSGKVFRLKAQGLPQLEGRGRGDQLVRVFIEVPTKMNDRQKELLREFAEHENKSSGNKSFFEKIANYFS